MTKPLSRSALAQLWPPAVRLRKAFGRREHLYLQADGRTLACAGPGLCRECNREAVRADVLRRPI